MKSWWILSCILAWSGLAWAQAPASAKSGDQLHFETKSHLSGQQQEKQSSQALHKMRKALTDVLHMLRDARSSKDVVRLNCVNEKLTQVKAFIKVGEQADLALQEDVAKQDSTGSDHEFTKVEIAGQRVAQLRADAEACIGQVAITGTGGQTHVDVTEPGDLPTATTSPAPPAPPAVTAPPPASPVE